MLMLSKMNLTYPITTYISYAFHFSMSEVVKKVSKKSIPSHVRSLVFELCVDDDTGEDVEVPYVKYNLP